MFTEDQAFLITTPDFRFSYPTYGIVPFESTYLDDNCEYYGTILSVNNIEETSDTYLITNNYYYVPTL